MANTTTPRRRRGGTPNPDRTWTEAESDAAFDALGDRLIEATRRFARSSRRQSMQADLYTVAGRDSECGYSG